MIEVVIKVGGALLRAVEDLDLVLNAVARLARSRPVLVVPGGGPFADLVRETDWRIGIPDHAAHWMAVLGMDQYAHLLAARMPAGVVVSALREAAPVVGRGGVPVLAPSRWLSDADPFPHSWDVTSDSVAAWVAGQAGACELVLVKARGASGHLVDRYFERAVPRHVTARIVTADRAEAAFAQIAGKVNPDVDTT